MQRGTRPDTGCPSATFADGLSAPTVLILVNRFFLSGRFFPTYIFFHAEKIKATRVRIITPVDELSAPIPEHDTPSPMDEQVAPVGVRPWAVKGQDVGTFEPASILAALPGFGGIDCAQLNGKSMRQLGRGQQDGKGRDVGGFFVVADAAAGILLEVYLRWLGICAQQHALDTQMQLHAHALQTTLNLVSAVDQKVDVVDVKPLPTVFGRFPAS